MFAFFRAGGQPESAARVNAEKFARESHKRGMPGSAPTISGFVDTGTPRRRS